MVCAAASRGHVAKPDYLRLWRAKQYHLSSSKNNMFCSILFTLLALAPLTMAGPTTNAHTHDSAPPPQAAQLRLDV